VAGAGTHEQTVTFQTPTHDTRHRFGVSDGAQPATNNERKEWRGHLSETVVGVALLSTTHAVCTSFLIPLVPKLVLVLVLVLFLVLVSSFSP
jgi:hypothetical protein